MMNSTSKRLITSFLAALLLACTTQVARAQIDDHLQCYKIKDPHKFTATADLQTSFGGEPGCKVKVKGALFCVPAIKQIVSSDGPITPFNGQTLEDDRICYKMKCPTNAAPSSVGITDQFGIRSGSKLKPTMLCTPAAKVLSGTCPTTMALTTVARGANVTPTKVETGYNGLGHKDDLASGYTMAFPAACANASPPCGDCSLSGTSLMTGRCSNNRTITCTALNANDAACGGSRCDFFPFGTQPVSVGGSPVCIQTRLTSSPSGVMNNETGVGSLSFNTATDVYLGISQSRPCPVCVSGLCLGGARNGLGCTIDASDPTFGATSLDCPSNGASLLTGTGIRRSLNLTTGADSLAFSDTCEAPLASFNCACGVCSLDTTRSCQTDGDCVGFGVCNNGGGGGPGRRPNACSSVVCQDIGGGQGQCPTPGSDDDNYCTGLVRADGNGILGCNSNADCTALDSECPGSNCGTCSIVERRPCFPDPIVVQGNPDPSSPVMSDAVCVGLASNNTVNSTYGLPGPERLRLQFTLSRF